MRLFEENHVYQSWMRPKAREGAIVQGSCYRFVEPRRKGIHDIYYFGYGHDYKQALRDFYTVTGPTPMLPRKALGNW